MNAGHAYLAAKIAPLSYRQKIAPLSYCQKIAPLSYCQKIAPLIGRQPTTGI